MEPTKRLFRSREDRVFGGVSGGLGEYFSIDSNLIRLGFVLLSLAGGGGIILYLICWLVIPLPGEKSVFETIKFDKKIGDIQEDVTTNFTPKNTQNRTGFWLIVIGLFLLLINFNYISFEWIVRLWPLILIAIGWQVYSRPKV